MAFEIALAGQQWSQATARIGVAASPEEVTIAGAF